MKRSYLTTPMFGAALLVLLGACAVEERTVVHGPPPDRVEVIPPRPSPEHVWVKGRWEAHGSDYSWVEGRWERH